MASRRVRIKGIANIPQRKKPNTQSAPDQGPPDDQDTKKGNEEPNLKIESPHVQEATNEVEENAKQAGSAAADESAKQLDDAEQISKYAEQITKHAGNVEQIAKQPEEVAKKVGKAEDEVKSKELNMTRRRSIRPSISLNAINRKAQDDIKIAENKISTKILGSSTLEIDNKNSEIECKTLEAKASLEIKGKTLENKNKPVEVTSEIENNPIEPTVENKTQNSAPKPLAIRRRFIKPSISLNAINRKIKSESIDAPFVKPASVENRKVEEEKLQNDDVTSNDSFEGFTVPASPGLKGTFEDKHAEFNSKSGERTNSNINLNEVAIGSNFSKKAEPVSPLQIGTKVLGITKLPKPQFIDGTKSGSDSEYPPQAASPSKFVNRRIKAVPRLGQRRTSFSIGSASESEDDTRRSYGRIRNDSVCSVTSITNENLPVSDNISPLKKEFSSVIQRKCKRTEQSRKLAEARRDFQMRFSNGKPDKHKLTMLDLIFYTPATAPMSQKRRSNSERVSESISEPAPLPPKIDKEAEPKSGSDEENTVPAPQITIGANGEIIIDEKSLVIENKETIKSREALKHSEIVDGDFDTNYGMYKRVKRSKDWSKSETLRFYKALNTIGTDFTLMCELFPGRNRRELKMKFKKEERMNRTLIDRAVTQPLNFDMTELREEVEIAEMEKIEMERRKQENRKRKEDISKWTKKKKRGPMGPYIQSIEGETREDSNVPKVKRRRLTSRQEFVKNGINSIIDSDSDDNQSTTTISSKRNSDFSDSDCENTESRNKVQITRSGRLSKPKNLKIEEEKPQEKEDSDEDLTPGSIMIITNVNNEGQTQCEIYTIDETGKKVPIELTPEILENLTSENLNALNGGVKNTNDVKDTSSVPDVTDNCMQHNGSVIMPKDTSVDLTDMTLTHLNSSDLMNDTSMIIPFDEFDSNLLNNSEVPDLPGDNI